MEEMLEILFEDVQLQQTAELLVQLNSTSTLLNYQIATDDPEVELNLLSSAEMFNTLGQLADGALYFNFSEFSLNGFEFSNVGMQVHKYEGKYDLSVDLKAGEVKAKASLSNLRQWAASIAQNLNARFYYCGIEPAADEETRFFSGPILGPLKGW